MAFASTVTLSPTLSANNVENELPVGGILVVTITETDCGTSSESTIALVKSGMVMEVLSQKCARTAGTGTTVDPILGRATNPSGVNIIVENATAAAAVGNAPSSGAPFYVSGSTLYHRSQPNAGSDNTIATEYILRRVR